MKKKLRLLTIGHSYVVALNRRLAAEFACMDGWEVVVAAPTFFHGGRDLRSIASEPHDGAYRLEQIPARLTNRVHLFSYGKGLCGLLREGFDIVHCWEEPFIFAGGQIAWHTPKKVPLVFATFQNLPKRYPPPFNWIERYSMGRSAGWIAFGTTVAETLHPRPYYASRPMRVIPPGVDIEHFQPDRDAGGSVRRALGWSEPGPPVVGYLGRFIPEKGLHLLMKSLEAVVVPWRALFVGGGEMESALRSWGQRFPDRVRICTGVVHKDVPRYINAMDMLCAPSQTTPRWREQFGRMLTEGFACGVPVIASDSGEIPYVVGDAGIILPEGDGDAWTRRIGELIESPSARVELAQRGRRRACEVFAWSVVAKRHAEFFGELMGT